MRFAPCWSIRRDMRLPGEEERRTTSPGSRPHARRWSCASRMASSTREPRNPAGPLRAICFGRAERIASPACSRRGVRARRACPDANDAMTERWRRESPDDPAGSRIESRGIPRRLLTWFPREWGGAMRVRREARRARFGVPKARGAERAAARSRGGRPARARSARGEGGATSEARWNDGPGTSALLSQYLPGNRTRGVGSSLSRPRTPPPVKILKRRSDQPFRCAGEKAEASPIWQICAGPPRL